ncbi:MAG: hypothetical protein KDE53_08110, partial [Caldilineaceae bacterium]|nr:hypothetical protein [Caldilineaceae bacterium]
NITQALTMTADALVQEEPVPTVAVTHMAKPLISTFAYTLIGNLNWILAARKEHVVTQLGARPFA